jgi:hypothetical protein
MFTAMMLSLTLVIPLIIIWILFSTLQRRAELKMESEIDVVKEKNNPEITNNGKKSKIN